MMLRANCLYIPLYQTYLKQPFVLLDFQIVQTATCDLIEC